MTVKEFFDVFGDIKITAPCGLYQGYRNELLNLEVDTFVLRQMVSPNGIMAPKELAVIVEKDNQVYKKFPCYDYFIKDEEILNMEIIKVKSFYIDHCTNQSAGGAKYYYNMSTLKIIVK